MENTCQNCGNAITVNFCANCGQKKFKRIDRKYLIDEMQYSLIHMNKGFFYSVKKILRDPGQTAKEFIDGDRVNHYKPLLLAFVLSGISAMISLKIVGVSDVMEQFYAQKKMNISIMHDYMSVVNSYSSFMMLLFIPLVSILTYLIFRNWGTNYYEHIIMNAYIQCFYTISCILILYPILYFLKDSPDAFITATMISMLSISVIMVWFYKSFYSEKSFGKIILKTLLFFVIGFVLYILTSILGVVIYIMANGMESLKDFTPKQ